MRSSRVAAIGRRLRRDGGAGVVLGVQSVPDGLATGLLAGVNPLAGLYGYLVGTRRRRAAHQSTFMVVQGTGAMAMVIADVPAVHDATDPARALVTLSILTGVVMLVAGVPAGWARCCGSCPTPSWSGSSTRSASTSCSASSPT